MTNTSEQSGDTANLIYACRLPPSTNTVTYIADLLRRRLKAIGSRWRSHTPGQIAVLVLAVLRHDQRAADLAGGNQVSATTIRRWTDEVIALLAAKAPRLNRALKNITNRGGEVVLLDGTVIRTRRRSGKANRTEQLIQVGAISEGDSLQDVTPTEYEGPAWDHPAQPRHLSQDERDHHSYMTPAALPLSTTEL